MKPSSPSRRTGRTSRKESSKVLESIGLITGSCVADSNAVDRLPVSGAAHLELYGIAI